MANSNKKALFWTSYSDLMTSLFFAMLVLFVVVVVAMGAANREAVEAKEKLEKALKEANATNTQLQQILRLQDQFNTLTASSSMKYDEEKRMFYAKDFVGIEIFKPNEDVIKDEYIKTVDKVGKDIKELIESLKANNNEFKYQLVIEGTAAIPYKELRAGTYNPDNISMYELSYHRALALYNRWKHLDFRKSNTEIIIAGSGLMVLTVIIRMRIITNALLFKLYLKLKNQMQRRNNIWILLIAILTLSISGCRKASTKGARTHYKEVVSEAKPNESRQREKKSQIDKIVPSTKKLSGAEVFKRYGKAVFMIFTSDGTNNYQGSGFFIGSNGLAVSNYHVFQGTNIGGENIKLSNDENTLYKVSEVIYKCTEPDFIVFRVSCNNSTYIPISKNKPSIGERVYAIGSPRGLENTFSSGEVSQWRGEHLMQISALIDHGSSGGALINEYGEAVGITSGSFYDGSQANLNYAWSIDIVKPYIK